METVLVSGSFDDLRSRHVRFLHEASRLGRVHVHLWSDAAVVALTGQSPQFPETERFYLLQALRFVDGITLSEPTFDPQGLPALCAVTPTVWAVDAAADSPAWRAAIAAHGVRGAVIGEAARAGFPVLPAPPPSRRRKVIVTGCYDWFHSGHVRFFEEVAAHGELYVVVGSDANVALLKGPGHPLLREDERRYMVAAVRHVAQCLVSSGTGWMDAAPEIARLKPDVYAVNADGDKPEKREFCATHGLEYLVLERQPKPGLVARSSTKLRGF